MEPVSTRLSDDTHRNVCERADANGESNSAVVRRLVEHGIEYGESDDTDERIAAVREDLEAEIADREREIERLNRERRQLLEQREEHTDLVRAVERERSLDERKARANWLTRQKWRVLGVPGDEG